MLPFRNSVTIDQAVVIVLAKIDFASVPPPRDIIAMVLPHRQPTVVLVDHFSI